jgi:hypothetical protein
MLAPLTARAALSDIGTHRFSGNHIATLSTYVFAVLFRVACHFGTDLDTPKPAFFALECGDERTKEFD